MNSSATRSLRPLHIPLRKNVEFDSQSEPSSDYRALSPDLQPNTPPTFPCPPPVEKIGDYLLTKLIDATTSVQVFKAIHCETGEELVCKVAPLSQYRALLAAYAQAAGHAHVNSVRAVVVGATRAYLLFARHYGDLHSYVRQRRRLGESEAARLLRQVVGAVAHCHRRGIVLRDLKLRKFVFKDAARTQLKLESLEDACVLSDATDDSLTDRRGCPAYVSPEILSSGSGSGGGGAATGACARGRGDYSGRAADAWSVGVMAYTLLVGRYPFHDRLPTALFVKIRRGQYTVPDALSSRARCLVRSLLQRDPQRRLTPAEVLRHPWLAAPGGAGTLGGSGGRRGKGGAAGGGGGGDQMVPEMAAATEGVVADEDDVMCA